MNLQELSSKLIGYFGRQNQQIKAISELGELIQALADYNCMQLINKPQMLPGIIEEIADVEVILDQLKEIFGRDKCAVELDRKIKKIEELL